MDSSSSLLMRCRLYNLDDIAIDKIRIVNSDSAKKGIRFKSNQEISKVLLTLWNESDKGDEWEIWFEKETSLVRQLNLSVGNTKIGEKLGLKSLQDINTKSKTTNLRIKSFEKVSQTSYRSSLIGDYSLDPWAYSSNLIRNYVNFLFPKTSDGEFFQKGWGKESPSVLDFSEWFRSLTNQSINQTIKVIDPYFDTVGIELIASSLTTNTSFEVITCTQLQSNDDTRDVNEFEPNRASRIKEECKVHKDILQNIDLTITDLRSKIGRGSSVFHDRYILLYNSNGKIYKGYHLSNSIQAATKFDPLLITPIPTDIVSKVDKYITFLISNNKDYNINKLYPENVTEHIKTNFLIENNAETTIETINAFWSKYFTTEDLISIDYKFAPDTLFYIESEKLMCEGLMKLANDFNNFTGIEFRQNWIIFSSWLSKVPNSNDYLKILCKYTNINFLNLLQKYLIDTKEISFEKNDSSQEYIYTQYFSFFHLDFEKSLEVSNSYIDGIIEHYLLGHFDLQYAIQSLIILEPSMIISILNDKKATLFKNQSSIIKDRILISYLIDAILDYLKDKNDNILIDNMIRSEIPSLKSLASQFAFYNEDMLFVAPDLEGLNSLEKLLSYTEYVYNLRISMNKLSKNSDLEYNRRKVYEKIILNWYINIDKDLRNKLFNKLSGVNKGAWSVEIYNELMIPLICSKKLTSDEASLFWINLLLEKIEDSNFFYSKVDNMLTNLCAHLFCNLSSEETKTVYRKIEKIISKINREIRKPFSKSSNFSSWNQAKLTGIWLAIFLKLTLSVKGIPELKKILNSMDKELRKKDKKIIDRSLYLFAKKYL